MDAYSISHTTRSRRGTSRIYQDLAACRTLQTRAVSDPSIQQLIMDGSQKIRTANRTTKPRIGIVGAGIAGLRCADVLLKHGFDVTILEARDRTGGRAHQVTLPSGYSVDLGPNWIHGTEHNPILDLAKQTNTPTHTWDAKSHVFGEDGIILEEGASLMESMWNIVVQGFKDSATNTSTIDSQTSLHDFFSEKVHELHPGPGEEEIRRKVVMQMSELWGAFVGSPVTTQSLKFFWLEECLDGENLFCAGTYKNIISQIAEPAKKDADIKLSTKVVCVKSGTKNVKLRTVNGLELEFDEVVMTNPLGWLKINKDVFTPPLPPRFSQAIDSIGYGSLEKVYITFPKAFWLKEGVPDSDQFTSFTQWLSPFYAADTNPELWSQEAVDLSTLPGSCKHPTMLYYMYGAQSIALSNSLSALPTEQEKQDYLIKFFKPYFSRLPSYSQTSPDCVPTSCLFSDWIRDEYAGYGSYTTFRTGLTEGDKDIEIMREGLPGRSLWFAGEHTAPFVALGTVTGAYWSGEAVGERIAEAYGMGHVAKGRVGSIPDMDDLDTTGLKEVNFRGFADSPLEK
ncbi:hypothetical protein HYALB_00004995 [Hymenoscyphus albidus]|uniref:Amine oxidase domain-containing protein n=1 Tax=Hymenoscyphus albidus TaxID=595503 RepID=A0A9N9LTY9_9HELO|nr:hypothetical protein HYALB_00004995 [Hymenoscyphus albidus]